ncbi:MAG TPA: helix-turn-helix domain-containing protein [Marmoricola sp.]|nr:helix-turn-helix domain-containing protein [Marmoricola sp.]
MQKTETTTTGRRLEVLTFLRARTNPTGIAEIAEGLDVHVNTVRFHLNHLVKSGQVEQVSAEHRGQGRPPLLFAAVRAMDPTGPRHYRLLAEILVSGLATEGDSRRHALRAGLIWGHQQAEAFKAPENAKASRASKRATAVRGLARVLDDLDFAPEIKQAKGMPVIDLHHCPFLDLAGTRSEIVCPIHLGLMRGILESWDAPVAVQRLDPFVQPDLCTAHLTYQDES